MARRLSTTSTKKKVCEIRAHEPVTAHDPAVHPNTRLIVGISGATGVILGVRLLQVLKEAADRKAPAPVETHLVLSHWGARTLLHETQYTLEQVQQLATRHYPASDQGAPISSGSFVTAGMVVCPCSARTLAAIAHGHGDNLL